MATVKQDQFGTLKFPVQIPLDDHPVHDPALFYIGSYLTAVLNSKLTDSWQTVNPRKPFVKTFQTNDPSDGTFNEADLNGLFLWRSKMTSERGSDDWSYSHSDITLLWIPEGAVQSKRAMRSPGINGFEKTIVRALGLGRDPSWIDPLDTSADSQIYGSVLIERAALYQWPLLATTYPQDVSIQKGEHVATYKAFCSILQIVEITRWEPEWDPILSAPRSASKLDETVTSGSLQLEALIPTT